MLNQGSHHSMVHLILTLCVHTSSGDLCTQQTISSFSRVCTNRKALAQVPRIRTLLRKLADDLSLSTTVPVVRVARSRFPACKFLTGSNCKQRIATFARDLSSPRLRVINSQGNSFIALQALCHDFTHLNKIIFRITSNAN